MYVSVLAVPGRLRMIKRESSSSLCSSSGVLDIIRNHSLSSCSKKRFRRRPPIFCLHASDIVISVLLCPLSWLLQCGLRCDLTLIEMPQGIIISSAPEIPDVGIQIIQTRRVNSSKFTQSQEQNRKSLSMQPRTVKPSTFVCTHSCHGLAVRLEKAAVFVSLPAHPVLFIGTL